MREDRKNSKIFPEKCSDLFDNIRMLGEMSSVPLKFKFKVKDEIPADVLAHYVERDGAWVLDVEGAVDRSRVDEFRANNVALMKQLDELKARFNGIDLEETKALKESILTRVFAAGHLDRCGAQQASAQVGDG